MLPRTLTQVTCSTTGQHAEGHTPVVFCYVDHHSTSAAGKQSLERELLQLDEHFPDTAKGIVQFSTPLAHQIIAGSDFMLVPSRFEPCGLIQLHAMQYGSVPLVATTGQPCSGAACRAEQHTLLPQGWKPTSSCRRSQSAAHELCCLNRRTVLRDPAW